MAKRNQNEVRPEDSLTFAGLETCDEDRAKAAALSMREEMETRLRSTRGDISAKAGRMERESPLFFGTGDSPLLW
jgi:hypothetical protein